MKELKKENLKSKLSEPKLILPFSTILFACSIASKSHSATVLSLGGLIYSLSKMSADKDGGVSKATIGDRYYEMAYQMHDCVERNVRLAFNELRYEQSPKRRREIMNTILWMKKNDVLRNADKKALIGLTGRKRKGLAKGLKNLRQQSKHLTREEYLVSRENILSYY